MPAYEDPANGCSRKRSCPENVDPLNSEALRSRRSARASPRSSSAGLTAIPSGYVLPVQRWNAGASEAALASEMEAAARQALPRARRFAVGYRLPLGSLPHRAAGRVSLHPPAGPDGAARPWPRPGLPERAGRSGRTRARPPPHPGRAIRRAQVASRIQPPQARTAGPDRAGDRRDSRAGAHRAQRRNRATAVLCVFLPPVERLEDYLDLIAACRSRERRSASRSISRAMRRRMTRASTSSRSRPIPA
jgi:uncharacterized protein (DUF2126 family)